MIFGNLIDRLRRWLRTWLQEDRPISRSLEIVHGGQIIQVVGIQSIGLMINCTIVGPSGGQRLVGVGAAIDQDHFWRLWHELGGGPLQWEDGTPFQPI